MYRDQAPIACGSCRHDNPGGAKFCNQCGKSLAVGPISFSLSDGPHRGLDTLTVRFPKPLLTAEGGGFWITLVEADAADSAYGRWQYVDDGAEEVELSCPPMGGRFEVRLHGDYPRQTSNLLFRQALEIENAGRPTPGATFTLAAERVSPGGEVLVRFGEPVPSPPTARHWVTIIHGWEPDTQYGPWQYVEDGATEMRLTAPTAPGPYEVRLHSHYPLLPARLAQRAPIDVG